MINCPCVTSLHTCHELYHHNTHRLCVLADRKNQEMEQDSAALQQDKERLESEAAELAQRLDAVMHDKFEHQSAGFDADTPIDKTLNFLHCIIAVRLVACSWRPARQSPA